MVLAGKTGLYFHPAFLLRHLPGPVPTASPPSCSPSAPLASSTAPLIAITRNDLKELAAFSTLSHLSFHHPGHLYLHHLRPRWRHLPDPQPRHLRRRPSSCSSASSTSVTAPMTCATTAASPRSSPGSSPSTSSPPSRSSVCPGLNSFVGEFLILAGTMQAVFRPSHRLDRPRHHRRHPVSLIHAGHDPAHLPTATSAQTPTTPSPPTSMIREHHRPLAPRRLHGRHGHRQPLLDEDPRH